MITAENDYASETSPLRILVADDSLVDNKITCMLFARHGHDVVSAANGKEAVERCREQRPDIIIMDCNMPTMDGFEATVQIRKMVAGQWLPIVMVSGLDAPQDIVRGLELGADDFLTKPVHHDVLLTKIRLFQRALSALRRLRASYAHYRSINASALDGIITTNQDGVILTANKAAEGLFGSEACGLPGRRLEGLLESSPSTESAAAHWGHWTDDADGAFEGIGKRIDGSTFPLTLRVSSFQGDAGENRVVIVRDETLRKQHESRLDAYRQEKQRESEVAAEVIRNIVRQDGATDPLLRSRSLPASEFSGDIVLAERAAGDVPYFFVADATGHGLAAAICVLPLVRMFRTMIAKECTVAEIASEMNRHLYEMLPTGFFVAAMLVRMDIRQRQVEIWNGGLPSGYLLDTRRDWREFRSMNLPLGILPPEEFTPHVELTSWHLSSQLIVHTDGLNEACNETGEEFGAARLVELFRTGADGVQLERIVEAHRTFLGGRTPSDDVTIVVATLP
jgi:PAS domain S-box-containing protein